jgi:small subunit ribosomal protein S8
MSLSDPIADMLTRIRNAVRNRSDEVNIRASNVCQGVALVLQQEGYIRGFDRIDDDSKQGILRVALKYSDDGEPLIKEIKRVSTPGRRVYSGVGELPVVLSGMGIAVVSTSKGVVSDRICRKERIGGEILCTVC